MKSKLLALLVIGASISLAGCKKDDDKKTTEPEPTNYEIKVRNWIGYAGSTCTQRALGYVTVEPVDGSSGVKGYSFSCAPGAQKIVAVTLPKDGEYKVKVQTGENGSFVAWDNVTLTKGAQGYANITSAGDDIKAGSAYDNIPADDTSMGCQ